MLASVHPVTRLGFALGVMTTALALLAPPSSAIPTLVKDIAPNASGSFPSQFENVNGTLFFQANDGSHGIELWKSNGSGGSMVKDINPTGSSNPRELTNVNGTLYFRADDGEHGRELWRSDGSEGGTYMVEDSFIGGNGDPESLTNVNGTLFFEGRDFDHNRELWRSDGTESGTHRIADSPPFASELTLINGTLFFTGGDSSTGGNELWKHASGATTQVMDINPGNDDDPLRNDNSNPFDLTNVNGTLFFQASDGSHGIELWKSNGAGANMVRDIITGSPSSLAPNPDNFRSITNVNGTVLFKANDGLTGFELWRSNGTELGTVRVDDIKPGGATSHAFSSSFPESIANVNGKLFLLADDGSRGKELWTSNGTAPGTDIVEDINPANGVGSDPKSLTNVNGTAFFVANDGSHGAELWKSDGTEQGTNMVQDIYPGNNNFYPPSQLTNVNGSLYFAADDSDHGMELWVDHVGGPPTDTDGDGIPDTADDCPAKSDLAAPRNPRTGCPRVATGPQPTNGNDVLNGNALPNVICGLLGNDTISGLGQNDTLYGDRCNDKTKTLFGAAVDTDGNDKLDGGDGDDTLYGAGGKDTLKGGKGKDKLFGGKANDKLTGGGGVNSYKGGAGNDTLNAKNGKKETVDCGGGKKDKASVDKADVVKGCETVTRAK